MDIPRHIFSELPSIYLSQDIISVSELNGQGLYINFFNCCDIRVISDKYISPCGGGLQYLHRSPVSRKRRRKENPVPRGITGPLFALYWGSLR
jgi:hypothetical protein